MLIFTEHSLREQEGAELLVGGWRMDGGSGEREKGGTGESQLCKRHVRVCYPHY